MTTRRPYTKPELIELNYDQASPGEIAIDMLTAAQARGGLPQLECDFSETNDSDGNLWTNPAIAALDTAAYLSIHAYLSHYYTIHHGPDGERTLQYRGREPDQSNARSRQPNRGCRPKQGRLMNGYDIWTTIRSAWHRMLAALTPRHR